MTCMAGLLMVSPAWAISLWKDDPLTMARVHCRLFALAQDANRTLIPELLDQISGPDGYEARLDDRAKIIYIGMTGGLPDFGFVVGLRWQTFTRDQRRDFNRAFADFLNRRFAIAPQDTTKPHCAMQADTVLLSEKPKAYRATVSTTVQGKDNHPIAMTYIFDKHPPERWNLEHLSFDHVDVRGSFSDVLNQLLAGQGMDGMLAWLRSYQLEREKHE